MLEFLQPADRESVFAFVADAPRPNPTGIVKYRGRGPDTEPMSDGRESKKLVAMIILSRLRNKLYQELPFAEFPPPGFRGYRPLRQSVPDPHGVHIIDPLIIKSDPETNLGHAHVNPQWMDAKFEWGFELNPGVLYGPRDPAQFFSSGTWGYEILDVWRVNPAFGKKFLFPR